MITTIRKILEKKGFDLTVSTLNWELKKANNKFFSESMPYLNPLLMKKFHNEVLDTKFDMDEGHPLVRYFEAFSPDMEISILFLCKPFKTQIEVEFLNKDDESDEEIFLFCPGR